MKQEDWGVMTQTRIIRVLFPVNFGTEETARTEEGAEEGAWNEA
jgi:hypothetical protein